MQDVSFWHTSSLSGVCESAETDHAPLNFLRPFHPQSPVNRSSRKRASVFQGRIGGNHVLAGGRTALGSECD
jgi:hypothetical protein